MCCVLCAVIFSYLFYAATGHIVVTVVSILCAVTCCNCPESALRYYTVLCCHSCYSCYCQRLLQLLQLSLSALVTVVTVVTVSACYPGVLVM